jgi:hypothetical protein
MNRSKTASLAAASTLVLLAAVAVWQIVATGRSAPIPTLADVVFAPQSGLTEQLYPADVDVGAGQTVIPAEHRYNVMSQGIVVASYTLNKDRTSQELFNQGNGVATSYLKDFFAPLPGELGPRQSHISFFAADGKTVLSEEWDRLDGTAEKTGRLLQDGNYQVFVLFADGQTAAAEQLWTPNPFADGQPNLSIERRWRPVAEGHTLSYTDLRNDDGTREQTELDGAGRPLMQKHIPLHPPVGMTVKRFYPGTDTVRLEGKIDWRESAAKEYRLDGSLYRQMSLHSYAFEPRYFDSTGKIPLFEQTWYKRVDFQGNTAHIRWLLGEVVELNPDGSSNRIISFDEKGSLSHEMRFHCTVDGITYERVFFWYREDGTLSKVELVHPQPNPDAPMQTIEHTSAENIRIVFPPELLVPADVPSDLPFPPDEDSRRDH